MINLPDYNPADDPMVMGLAASICRSCWWDQPDVLVDANRLPDQIHAAYTGFGRRIAAEVQLATKNVGSLVDAVEAGVAIVNCDTFHTPPAGPAELRQARASRTQAARIELGRDILRQAAQVETATEVHRRTVDALQRATVEAADHLYAVLRQHHRHGVEFTFVLPAVSVDPAVYEIGLTRVRNALGHHTSNDTGAGTHNNDHTDTHDTQRGAA